MDEVVATEMASKVVEREGYEIQQYNVLIKRTSDVWEIHFARKDKYKPSPGDFVTVYIDEQSESVERVVRGK